MKQILENWNKYITEETPSEEDLEDWKRKSAEDFEDWKSKIRKRYPPSDPKKLKAAQANQKVTEPKAALWMIFELTQKGQSGVNSIPEGDEVLKAHFQQAAAQGVSNEKELIQYFQDKKLSKRNVFSLQGALEYIGSFKRATRMVRDPVTGKARTATYRFSDIDAIILQDMAEKWDKLGLFNTI